MVLIHHNSVMVLSTRVTATTGMLTVLSDTTVTGGNVSSLLAILVKAGRHGYCGWKIQREGEKKICIFPRNEQEFRSTPNRSCNRQDASNKDSRKWRLPSYQRSRNTEESADSGAARDMHPFSALLLPLCRISLASLSTEYRSFHERHRYLTLVLQQKDCLGLLP